MVFAFIIRTLIMFACFVMFWSIFGHMMNDHKIMVLTLNGVMVCFSAWFISRAFRYPID